MRAACLEMVHELARRDARVIYIGSDLGTGTLDAMKREMPDRFFMEGVSEANMIGMAAGLAMDGYIPYVHTIGTFITRRAYEQVAVDLCLHDLPVRLIGNGGGLVYAPLGPTHMSVEDIATMRALPGMAIVAPADADEMRAIMTRTIDHEGPLYIRLAKGHDPIVTPPDPAVEIGRAKLLRQPGEVLFVGTGVMTGAALEAAEQLEAVGINAGVLHMHTVKPLDGEALLDLAPGVWLIVSIEEHSRVGGLGSAIAELLMDNNQGTPPPRLLRLGLPDKFISEYGSQDFLLECYGLDPASIVAQTRDALESGPLAFELQASAG